MVCPHQVSEHYKSSPLPRKAASFCVTCTHFLTVRPYDTDWGWRQKGGCSSSHPSAFRQETVTLELVCNKRTTQKLDNWPNCFQLKRENVDWLSDSVDAALVFIYNSQRSLTHCNFFPCNTTVWHRLQNIAAVFLLWHLSALQWTFTLLHLCITAAQIWTVWSMISIFQSRCQQLCMC